MDRRRFLAAAAAAALAPAALRAQPVEHIVLVHGLWMTGAETGLLGSRLRDDYGFDVRTYSYYSVSVGLEENVARLAKYLAEVPGDTLHVVGHSLGGLLALHTAMRLPDKRPGRIVCLGSPLRGSAAARALAALPFGLEIMGATVRDAILNGGLESWQGKRDVGVVAGTRSLGLGEAVGQLPVPNDGTIAAVETQLPGVKDYLELDVSHTGMLMAPVVVSQTAYFLRHGVFARTSPAAG